MDRLTMTQAERAEDGVGYAIYLRPELCTEYDKRLSAYEDTGLTPEEINTLHTGDPLHNSTPPADELRILRNFIGIMSKRYRERTINWVIVRDLIMRGTRTAGCTSCMRECRRIGIDPYGYTLEAYDDEDD